MRIVFIGAGSTVFAKNVLGDCILTPGLGAFEIALHDIDEGRLEDSFRVITAINQKYNGKAEITRTLNRREALKDADVVINAIQVGGYDPCTITDFEIPKKYGLRQTIGDTLGIGGIFRALRTIPVLKAIADDMAELCPKALLINYSNPMCMLTGYLQRYTPIQTVGLCHSVQVCVREILRVTGMALKPEETVWHIAGINHQAWLLKLEDKQGNDLYPEIRRRARAGEFDPHLRNPMGPDRVRMEILNRFGYYTTESSEHNAEYTPWFIKSQYPELIEQFGIPLDEYPRRCVEQMEGWANQRAELLHGGNIEHERSHEYASRIIEAMHTNVPYLVHGNVTNHGLITNLPDNACVEVPCLVDANGVTPCMVGALPEQCAALNRTNINVQLLAIEAAATRKKEYIYMAAYMDPHTAAELPLDQIKNMCDDLIEAHGDWLPEYC